jgi:Domain of unknown function (DUF4424)
MTAVRELVMRSVLRGLALATLLAAATLAAVALAAATLAESMAASDARPELHTEIAAGGLIFSGNLNLLIDQQDVTITADAIQVNYSIRNTDASDQAITIAFPFADVEGSLSPDAGIDIGNPTNFMDVVIDVDGRRPTYVVEQRATAVGLDVTTAIIDAQLPLFPLAADISRRIADLDPAVRNDLVERGILKADDDVVAPAWTLKTTAYWRQVFPAGQVLALSLSYKPVAGRNAFSSGALQPLKKGVCIDAVGEQSIMRLASQGAPLTMVSVGYIAHPGGEALGPVGRFRLTVDQSDIKSIVATCRQGLSKTGPTTSDWVARNYAVDEEFRFLFVR